MLWAVIGDATATAGYIRELDRAGAADDIVAKWHAVEGDVLRNILLDRSDPIVSMALLEVVVRQIGRPATGTPSSDSRFIHGVAQTTLGYGMGRVLLDTSNEILNYSGLSQSQFSGPDAGRMLATDHPGELAIRERLLDTADTPIVTYTWNEWWASSIEEPFNEIVGQEPEEFRLIVVDALLLAIAEHAIFVDPVQESGGPQGGSI